MKKWFSLLLVLLLVASCWPSLAEIQAQPLPRTGDMYEMLDLSDPYKTVISGLFTQTITVKEKPHDFFVYVGAENRQSESFVLLIPDSKQNVPELLEKGGWMELADAQGLIVAIAQPAGDTWDVTADMDNLMEMYKVTHNRGYYNAQKGNNYLAAYGDGATIAQMWAMAEPQNFASFATFGDIGSISQDFMTKASTAGTKLASVSIGDIPMPVWFFVSQMDDNANAVLAYWNNRNDVQEEMLSSDLATGIYLAKTNGIDSLINEQDFLAQTRYTVIDNPAAVDAQRTKDVWKFLAAVVRPVGFANNSLRSARTVEEWGATKKYIDVNGVTRYWVEFVPEQVFETTDGKVPLVVYFHGNNNTAEAMLSRSELIKVANDRGFIAIMLTGSLYNEDKIFPNPRWNLNEEENLFDDYTYVRKTIEDVCGRLPIDTTRIYAMGQSYGSMATLAFSLRMNDIFAAGAGTGGGLVDQFLGLYESDKILEGNLMPICVLLGEAEGGNWENEGVRNNYPYWLKRNGFTGDLDKDLTGSYKSGRFNVFDFANEKNVPLVQYITVDERIHTIVAMDLYFQYDTFVSKWSRAADGTLYYMGNPVEKK